MEVKDSEVGGGQTETCLNSQESIYHHPTKAKSKEN